MRTRYSCLALAFFLCMICNAQQNRLKFASINSAGWLKGETFNAFQLQSVNGVSCKTFFAGIGVGMDDYYIKTIPVFVDLRKSFFKKRNAPFLYADLGTNFPFDKEQNSGEWFVFKNTYHPAFYFDAGIGYDVHLSKIAGLVFSLGYSEKRLVEKQYFLSPVESNPPSAPTILNYQMRRFSLKAGIRL